MKLTPALILLAAVAPLAPARADDCPNATSQTQMTVCADQACKKSDAELNSVYKQITTRLKSNQDDAKLLVVAQRRWLAFRDAECAFSSSGTVGGSIQPMLVTQCRDELTGKRAEQLKRYLHCQEGDMTCPVPRS